MDDGLVPGSGHLVHMPSHIYIRTGDYHKATLANIKAVEVEIVGLLPQEGLHGTLRGGGLSHYRLEDGGEKSRIHTVDTLGLSEYTVRNDAFVYRSDPRIHGLFEGHGRIREF